jgi:hypothetical protein
VPLSGTWTGTFQQEPPDDWGGGGPQPIRATVDHRANWVTIAWGQWEFRGGLGEEVSGPRSLTGYLWRDGHQVRHLSGEASAASRITLSGSPYFIKLNR